MSNPNIAEKYYGKLKAQGEETIADFVWQQAETIKQLNTQIEILQKQVSDKFSDNFKLAEINAELEARVARLESCLETATNGVEWYLECFSEVVSENDYENLNEFKAALNETPQQSLAHIQADSVDRFADLHLSGAELIVANDYVAKLREQKG